MLRKNNGYMPDVLDCLANLSNDEVFTPPEVANKMLDLLPQELFESKDTKFLDPFTKSGVFLREITKRLLRNQLPDYETVSSEIDIIEKEAIQNAVKNNELDLNDPYYSEKARKIGHDAVERHERAEEFNLFERRLQRELNRIFSTQVFGIAITELTAQLSRRSLYCSKNAAGKYSVSSEFDTEEGNIRFKPMKHTWKDGSCIHCGANKSMFDRPDDFEQHAYEFIHNEKVEEIFMGFQFDVICGNPPYHISTGGGQAQAIPIYDKFIRQAKRLNPRYLTMIIPSRWFAGGMGLNKFRNEMMNDTHISHLVDYANAKDCFPGVSIGGGVSYFLWNKDYNGPCKVTNTDGIKKDTKSRYLNEYPIVVRNNKAVNILQKVSCQEMMDGIVSAISPFGLPTYIRGEEDKKTGFIKVYSSGGVGFIDKNQIKCGELYYDKYKVLLSANTSEHAGEPSKDGKFKVFASLKILEPTDVCTHSYITIGMFDTKKIANNCFSYLQTKFVRFLVLQTITGISISKERFKFVPMQDFTKSWTDEELYKKYNLTTEEIELIESTIKPMEKTIIEKSDIYNSDKDGDSND